MANRRLIELEDQIEDRYKRHVKNLILNGGNAKQAAVDAGFALSTAKARAAEWIRPTRDKSKKPLLFDYRAELLKDAQEVAGISVHSLLVELRSIAHSNITDIIQVNGGIRLTIKKDEEIPEVIKPAIQSISRTQTGITVKLYDKLEAIKMLLEFNRMSQDQGKQGSVVVDKIVFNVKGSQSKLLTKQDQNKHEKDS